VVRPLSQVTVTSPFAPTDAQRIPMAWASIKIIENKIETTENRRNPGILNIIP